MTNERKEKMNTLMYYLVKCAALNSFTDFLDNIGVSMEEYQEFKKELEKIGITETYI